MAVATLVKPPASRAGSNRPEGLTKKRTYYCYYRLNQADRVQCTIDDAWNDGLAIEQFLTRLGVDKTTDFVSLEISEKMGKDSYRPFLSYESKTATLVDKSKKKLSRKERRMLKREERERNDTWFADKFLIPNIGEVLTFKQIVVTKDDKPTRDFN